MTSFTAYSSNGTCHEANGSFHRHDCSSGTPLLHTFSDEHCRVPTSSTPLNTKCVENGATSSHSFWACSQSGMILPLDDSREEEHILADYVISCVVLLIVSTHFLHTLWCYVYYNVNRTPSSVLVQSLPGGWVPRKRGGEEVAKALRLEVERIAAELETAEQVRESQRLELVEAKNELRRLGEENDALRCDLYSSQNEALLLNERYQMQQATIGALYVPLGLHSMT